MEGTNNIHPRVKKLYKDFSLKFHPDRTELKDKKTASDIFARGSYLWNTSPTRFLHYCKEGSYLYVDPDLFKLVPQLDKQTMYSYIAKMKTMFEVMEKGLDVDLNPLKYDDEDKMLEHLVRIYFNKYIGLFKRIRKHYRDINFRIFMYERLDDTLQIKFHESWTRIYKFCVRKKRSILDPESLVQKICKTKGRIPAKYVNLLYHRVGEGVDEVIKGESKTTVVGVG